VNFLGNGLLGSRHRAGDGPFSAWLAEVQRELAFFGYSRAPHCRTEQGEPRDLGWDMFPPTACSGALETSRFGSPRNAASFTRILSALSEARLGQGPDDHRPGDGRNGRWYRCEEKLLERPAPRGGPERTECPSAAAAVGKVRRGRVSRGGRSRAHICGYGRPAHSPGGTIGGWIFQGGRFICSPNRRPPGTAGDANNTGSCSGGGVGMNLLGAVDPPTSAVL